MTEARRPRILIPGRLAEHTSVTRMDGLVTALRLAQAVYAAGGEPITLLPVENSDWDDRLAGIDGVLLPGGGDINPERYGQQPESEEIYGVVDLQDEVDLEIYAEALKRGLPLLAICRGFQLVNVAQGGTLIQDMLEPHRHYIHELSVTDPSALGLDQATVTSSCYHHQAIDQLGKNITVIARAETGNVEAFKVEGTKAWTAAVQWHPEDNYQPKPENLAIFKKLVAEARKHSTTN